MTAWDTIVRGVSRRPVVALLLGGILIAASVAGSPGLRFDSDTTGQLPRVSPGVDEWLELSQRFGAFDSLVIGLEEPEKPFTADGLARVKRITDSLAAAKAAGVLGVTSVTNVESISEGADGSIQTALLISSIPSAPAELDALAKRVAADRQVSGALISRDQRGYMLLVRTDPRHDMALIARLIQTTVEHERGPLSAAYFGAPFFAEIITHSVYAKLPWLVPVYVLALLLIMAWRVRRWSVVGLVIGSTGLALVGWLGLIRLSGVVLNFTSLTALLVLSALSLIVFSRGLEARFEARDPAANPFPSSVASALLATGLASVTLLAAGKTYLTTCGAVIGAGTLSIAVVGLLVFAPLAQWIPAKDPEPEPPRSWSRLAAGSVAIVALAAGGWTAARAPFAATPQTIFSDQGEVAQSLAFFDRRFGGSDFIQVSFRGDLRDPNVAARLMRFTDLLEGSKAFSDVRSVAQILGFLAHGFAGLNRIPTTHESLGSLWFFLEGRPDVRNLASSARDEAMLVLRIPSKPSMTAPELVRVVEQADADSLKTGGDSANVRLLALARAFGVTVTAEQVSAAVRRAMEPMTNSGNDELALSRLRTWLGSDDSPYQPTEDEWKSLATALAPDSKTRDALPATVATFAGLRDPETAKRFLDSVLAREKDIRFNLRTLTLAKQVSGPAASDAFIERAQGVFADLLDPQKNPGDSAKVSVTGLPVVAPQLVHDLASGLWSALALLIGCSAFFLLLVSRSPRLALRSLLEGSVATALALAAGSLMGIDSGSAPLYLLPPLAATMVCSGKGGRLPEAFMLGLGLASLSLLLVGVAPVSRIGVATVAGLVAVAMVNAFSRRVAH